MQAGEGYFRRGQELLNQEGLHVSLTQTPLERSRGLLVRPRLPSLHGLWIRPCNSVHSIGMRYPLDIIYLNRQLQIMKITAHLQPWRLSAHWKAASVLEFNAGTTHYLGLNPGDQFEWTAYAEN